ncbi:hypothetical protein MKZ38_006114 [Zalerion maritima]|uniref:Glycosyl transferase CAP10 domain-containing protein n=1 Tax=Zalerion maritima TaxID=339359 RepID=A0AAD5RVQ0_9PEZI|nr:hypothetical protein MKZ38_006114 [Zalerion maritima]
MRSRQQFIVGAILIFLGICYLTLPLPPITHLPSSASSTTHSQQETHEHTNDDIIPGSPAPKSDGADLTKPVPGPEEKHPVWHLISEAEEAHKVLVKRQSKTVAAAVKEYRRRYGIPPPPGFDKWFKFAQARNVVMVDEFDAIRDMMLPFWGLKPSVIRERAREMLGNPENMMLGIMIRDGNVTYASGGRDWMQNALKGMMAGFVKELGDLDLVFNVHDEPRVAVVHDTLDRLIRRGIEEQGRLSNKAELKGEWTKSAEDMGPGKSFEKVRYTRFNVYAHQPTWHSTKITCPADSPARNLDDKNPIFLDRKSLYAMTELGFLNNYTAHADPCVHPSLSRKHGLFAGANAFNLAHDLMPVFSQSKMSHYQDIIYPSPWYWNGNVKYDITRDPIWEEKTDKMYWRGSTTGGFARSGGWKGSQRMRYVKRVNDPDGTEMVILDESEVSEGEGAGVKEVKTSDYKDMFDVAFSEIGQCDAEDCAEMRETFELGHYGDRQTAWNYRYLIDIDGNAFSGRFYAFLQSRSLVFKLAVFREWHDEWLRPWLHYVPLSMDGGDWLEALRVFRDTKQGKKEGKRLAGVESDWANQVLRKEDLEVWYYRLLLEYRRVVDDKRDSLGFSP